MQDGVLDAEREPLAGVGEGDGQGDPPGAGFSPFRRTARLSSNASAGRARNCPAAPCLGVAEAGRGSRSSCAPVR